MRKANGGKKNVNSRHEVASGGWVREGGGAVPPPHLEENGNQ